MIRTKHHLAEIEEIEAEKFDAIGKWAEELNRVRSSYERKVTECVQIGILCAEVMDLVIDIALDITLPSLLQERADELVGRCKAVLA